MSKPANVALLIDDEPKIRRFLRAGFELNGYVVLEAPNAAVALHIAGGNARIDINHSRIRHARA